MRHWTLSILGLLFLALPSAEAGQETQQTVSSKLRNTFGIIRGRLLPAPGEQKLPPGVTATLTCRQYRDLYMTTEVTLSGIFEFRELDRGDYSIRIEAPGYSVIERSTRINDGTGQTVSISIALGGRVNPAGPTPNSGPKTVSVRWLSVPEKAKREMAEADRKSRKGEWREAIRHMEKALEIYPALPEAHAGMGMYYFRLNRLEPARGSLNRALGLNPDYVPAHRYLGMLYLRERKYPEASRHLERARLLEPEDYGTLYFSGEYHEAMGDPLRALAFYRKAFELNPDSYRLLRRIARIHSRSGMAERSLPLMEEFVRRNPEHRRASRIRSMIRQLNGDGSPPGSTDDPANPPT